MGAKNHFMKQVLLILLFMHGINSYSQEPAPDTAELAKLSRINAQFIKNFLKQDAASHDKIIHNDFVCIESTGQIIPREVYLKNWATDFENSGYSSFNYEDEVIRIFGNIALVRAKTVYTRNEQGKITKGYTIYTDTYLKENNEWKCIQVQITPVKK